jgi:sterol-4alpha-carboxylate 3-dehydrogenase (decarboxylating)
LEQFIGIFGPGDNQFWPSLIKVAQEGKSKFQIGDGKNLFDFTFVDNVAYAHILASDKLTLESGIGGEVQWMVRIF